MKVGEAYIEITADSTKLVSGLNNVKNQVSNSVKGIQDKMRSLGKGMTIVGGVITAAFGMAIKTAAQFEQSMANTASVASATSEELKQLSDYAREMGEQSVFSASQAADAMYYLGSAGMNAEEIMGSLEGTLNLAAATASDLAFTAEAVAASLSQFGLDASEADRIANVFSATISNSQATMEKLKISMSYVGPMASSMGLEIEEVTGILGNLYNAGIEASTAGTSLRMIFTKLIEAMDGGNEVLDELGVSITDASGKMKPFAQIVNELGDAGLTAGQSLEIFGQRAGPNMLALVNQGKGAIEELTEAVTGTNKATEMANMQIDTFEGSMKLLKSAFQEFQITLVQDLMPALRPFIEQIIEIIKNVSNWIKANPELAASITKLAAAIGAIALVGGPLLMAAAGFSAIAGAIGAIGTIATGPIGLLIAAISAAYLAWKNWDKILEYLKGLVETIKNLFSGLVKSMWEWGKNAISGFIEGIKSRLASLSETVKGIGTKIKNLLGFKSPPKEGPLADSDTWMPNMMKMFGEGIEKNTNAIIDPLQSAINNIKDEVGPRLEWLAGEMSRLFGMGGGFGVSQWLYNLRMAYEKEYAALKYQMKQDIKEAAATMHDIESSWSNEEASSTDGGWGSYQHGTPYVPKTGMALLHKGEAVIPANQNTYNNSFSPTVNLSVQGGGSSKSIAEEVQNVLYDMGRQFKRSGFEAIPGRS